jgi:hypothetical protein
MIIRTAGTVPNNPTTTFSDDFSGAGKFAGDNWAVLGCDASVLSMSSVDAAINLTAGQLVFGTGGGGLPNLRLFLVPFPAIDALSVKTKSLTRGVFAQMTYKSRSTGAGGFYSGIMAYNTAPDNGQGYYYGITEGGGAFVTRNIDATEANITASLYTVAVNDVLRLEVTPGSASNTVVAKRNGTIVSTVTDSNALRPAFTGGWFGMFFRYQVDAGASMNWDDFSGGVL